MLVLALALAIHRWPSLLPVLAVGAVPFRVPIALGRHDREPARAALRRRRGGRAGVRGAAPESVGVRASAPGRGRARVGACRVRRAVRDPGVVLDRLRPRARERRVLLRAVRAAVRAREPHRVDAAPDGGVPRACSSRSRSCSPAIGFVEYATRHLFLNPKVIASNQLEDYFRVNSLFFDPNIYGRFLAIVMLLVVAWLLWARRARDVVVARDRAGGPLGRARADAVAVELRGAAARARGARRAALEREEGDRAGRRPFLVLGAAFVLVAPSAVRLDLGSSKSANSATSGRYDLISGGVGLFADRPVQGWGSGSFPRQYRRAEHVSAERATSASHTIPITVAAEQGVIGLAAYLALLVLRAVAAAARRALRARRARGVAAAFVALRRAHDDVRRVPRGPADVDAARGRHRARGRRAAAAARSCRRRASRPRASGPPRRHERARARRADGAVRSTSWSARSPLAAVLAWALVPTYPNYDTYYHLVWGRELLDGDKPTFTPTRRRPSTRCSSRSARCSGCSAATPTASSCSSARCRSSPSRGGRTGSATRSSAAGRGVLGGAVRRARASRSCSTPRAPTSTCRSWRSCCGRRRSRRARRGAGGRSWRCSRSPACCGPRRGCSRARTGCGALAAGAVGARLRLDLLALAVAAPLIWAARRPLGHRRPAVLAARDERPRRRAQPQPRAGRRARARSCRSSSTRRARRWRSRRSPGAVLAWRLGAGRARARAARAVRRRRRSRSSRPGVAGLSVLPRYLTVPVVAVCIVAGYGVARLHDAARRGGCGAGGRARRSRAAVLGAGVRRASRRRVVDRLTTELRFIRGTHDDLRAILADAGGAARGPRCGPMTFPNYRLVPDTRWMLDLPARAGRRAQRAAPRARRRDLRRRAQGARALRLRRGREPVDERARPRLRPDRAQRALRGVRVLPVAAAHPSAIPSARSRSHSGPFCARARSAPAPTRAARASGRDRAPACARSAAANASASVGDVDRPRPRAHAGERGRDGAAAEARVLDDPVGQRGVVERLDAGTARSRRRRRGSAARRLVVERAEPDELPGIARHGREVRVARRTRPRARRRPAARRGRRQALGDRRAAAPSRCAGRGARARSRRPPPPSGAGKSSADIGTSAASRPAASLEAHELVGDGGDERARAAAAARAAPRGARAAAAARRRRARSGPSASTRARSRARRASIARATGSCSAWKITTTRGVPPRQRAQPPARLEPREPRRRPRAAARPYAPYGTRPGSTATTPRRAQQVLGLVAQDEALERRGQQEDAERRRAAWSAGAHGRGEASHPGGYRPRPWRASSSAWRRRAPRTRRRASSPASSRSSRCRSTRAT